MSYIDYMRLMIGDILMATYDDGEKVTIFPVVVDGIDENCTLVYGDSYLSWKPLLPEHKDMEYADELEPIPLTEEILKANGFTESQLEEGTYNFPIESIRNRGYAIETDDNKEFYISDHELMKFRYVHELQRALRCCGLWDMAEKFKIN